MSQLTRLVMVMIAGIAITAEAEIRFKATEVAPGLTMLSGEGGFAGGNLGLLTGDDATVLIDDGLEDLAATTLAAIEARTDRPVDFVINTHVHDDHIGGNAALHERGARVLAHDKLRARMVADGKPPEALPEITFSHAVNLYLNDHRINVFHLPDAHTDGDAVIHFPTLRVLHAGDLLFNGLFPFIDLDRGGSVDGYIAAQQRILATIDDDTRIIAGHGPLASRADLQRAVDMLVDARDCVQALVDEGRTLEEVQAAKPLADYHDDWNWGFITTERMTETLYRDLSADD